MKITTHGEPWGRFKRYSVDVDGRYLLGDNMRISYFSSRKHAKEEAERRMTDGNTRRPGTTAGIGGLN